MRIAWVGACLLTTACGEGVAVAGRCEILAETLVQLGEAGDEGSFATWPSVGGPFGGGTFLGASIWGVSEVPMRFAASGKFTGRLGTLGDGPGEYRGARLFRRYRGDSILVLDEKSNRFSVLDSLGNWGRSFVAPGSPGDVAVLSEGRLVLGDGRFREPTPIRVLDHEGTTLAAFGLDVAPAPTGNVMRFVARGRRGTIWALPAAGPVVLEEWTIDGSRLRSLALTRDWIAPDQRPENPTPTDPGSPSVSGLWQDEVGILWVIAVVPGRQWARGLGPLRKGEGGMTYYPIEDYSLMWDGLVEATDSATGALIASRRFEDPAIRVSEPGLVTFGRESEEGWWKAEVVRLRLSEACARR